MTNNKVLVLGSGPLKIGQAGEFDYSGSQALKALKQEGYQTILINPNIASVQTSSDLADQIYFEPITPHFVEQIIQQEKPSSILLSFGGQTALNCGIQLHSSNILQKYQVEVLGTAVESLILTEDRHQFSQFLNKLNIQTPNSYTVQSKKEVLQLIKQIKFPIIIRSAYSLGGHNSAIIHDQKTLLKKIDDIFHTSSQILLEEYLHHYKEIEYEVVRDKYDNAVAVCNMENIDPLGIHTGESAVVAPSQTLTNQQYHGLRDVALRIVRELKIVGECNVQFALNPRRLGVDYNVIEVNARLSRSSALASKATGYPLAYVAAKLALGMNLANIKNQITQTTSSFFEPALDYLTLKLPRWDLQKFPGVNPTVGSSMKSVGEIMAIGLSFEEILQKGIRMLNCNSEGITDPPPSSNENRKLFDMLQNPSPYRLFHIAQALMQGQTVEDIHKITGIDKYWLYRIQNITNHDFKLVKSKRLTGKLLKESKQLGFSDVQIAKIRNKTPHKIREIRRRHWITPTMRQIDTLAGEVPTQTNYLYCTYNCIQHDIMPLKKPTITLGSGPYCIGSSVEFDWSAIQTLKALKQHNQNTIVINSNPETVSTDYDVSDRLYFEELTKERILDIYEFENANQIIGYAGGQIANNIVRQLPHDINVLGPQPNQIELLENRTKFSKLLDKLKIPQPKWLSEIENSKIEPKISSISFPVIVRPSYVLSGSAMKVCNNIHELKSYLKSIQNKQMRYSITEFLQGAIEIELDGVANCGQILTKVITQHIEQAGIHSGDSLVVYPPSISKEAQETCTMYMQEIIKKISYTGPFNMQFLMHKGQVFCIEFNPRASRSFPFVSKATNTNLIYLLFDNTSKVKTQNSSSPAYFVVKAPQFSHTRMLGYDPMLGPEMTATGEVGCWGRDIHEAYIKSILSLGHRWPAENIIIDLEGKVLSEIAELIRNLETSKSTKIYSTYETHHLLTQVKISSTIINPQDLSYIKFQAAIIINDTQQSKTLRQKCSQNDIYLMTNISTAELYLNASIQKTLVDILPRPWATPQ